jgi:uncharacterized protein (DUF427 family)
MGLSWQQGPLSSGAIGHFLVPQPLPEKLLYAEPLRRRMRVRFSSTWIADSENVLLLFEPGRYPVAYFPKTDIVPGTLERSEYVTRHHELGTTSWYTVRAGEHNTPRGAWQHIDLPAYANKLQGRVAFAWRTMDAFYEEDERILGHAADSYHRIDIRQTSRRLIVRHADRVVADTKRPLVLYESGFAPRWYVPRADLDESSLTPVEHETFCPYKGLCSYYDIGDVRLAAWSYREPYSEVVRISDLVSFEPDVVSVQLDDKELRLEPGQKVIPHGPDRDLTVSEVLDRGKSA